MNTQTVGGANELTGEAHAGQPKVSIILMVGLFIAALMGNFTLGRLGALQFGELDLRVPGLGLLVAAALVWRFAPRPGRYEHSWPASAQLMLALFGYLAVTCLWSPPDARIAKNVVDLLFLAVLLGVSVSVSAPNLVRARRIMLVCLYLVGLLYALAGFVLGGKDEQGRTIAFGGGPDVYVRVVLLGLIASVALCVIYRRKLFLLATPAFGVAAFLSGSRGGLVSAVVIAVVVIALRWRRISLRAALASLLLVTGSLLGGALTLSPETLAAGRQRFITDLFVQADFSGRPDLLNQGLSIAFSHPLFGGGLDSFYPLFGVSENLEYPHNLIVDVAASGGLVAVILLVAVGWAFVREGRPWSMMPPEQLAISVAALFLFMTSMTSGGLYDSRFLWLFATLAVNVTPTYQLESEHHVFERG